MLKYLFYLAFELPLPQAGEGINTLKWLPLKEWYLRHRHIKNATIQHIAAVVSFCRPGQSEKNADFFYIGVTKSAGKPYL